MQLGPEVIRRQDIRQGLLPQGDIEQYYYRHVHPFEWHGRYPITELLNPHGENVGTMALLHKLLEQDQAPTRTRTGNLRPRRARY